MSYLKKALNFLLGLWNDHKKLTLAALLVLTLGLLLSARSCSQASEVVSTANMPVINTLDNTQTMEVNVTDQSTVESPQANTKATIENIK